MVLLWLMLGFMLLDAWYVVAFLVAAIRLHEARLLLLAAQGGMIFISFSYIAYTLLGQLSFNPVIALVPLIFSIITLGIWWLAVPSLSRFVQGYPRGFVDVLLFRRPRLTDLKRRVRTK